ncbi:EthD domain-containing protein [Parafrankia sp. BMG5.11]|uniref:EthD domain-containing protein n=1 Tax=Parafrankia sp. BMG5.11 TaxID=222540 RepID=UPI00103E24F5|nr:EthD domain-containing protein [Parafrankia sp. BMG5.11]TCJ37005.1 hypothetical protein E0504_18085 [Parafrankia sp. BMG5.11]
MEKLVCALWKQPEEPRAVFNERLLADLPGRLASCGAQRVQVNIRDDAIAAADSLVQQWQSPQQDAVVQFWLPSANGLFRGSVDAALSDCCGTFASWLVAESTIIDNDEQALQPGERTHGWSQASFISFRPDMSRKAAIAHWHSHHTKVAIDTQANFEYVQNLIVMPLTEDAPAYDAFVEECFPAVAMTDPAAFFDAQGDKARLDANIAAMAESCAGFIDFARIDIIPTSQYRFGDG